MKLKKIYILELVSLIIVIQIIALFYLLKDKNNYDKRLKNVSNWSEQYENIKHHYSLFTKSKDYLINIIDIHSDLNKIQYQFLDDADIIQKITKCNILTISPSKVYTKDIFRIIDYHLTVEGRYKDLFMFLFSTEMLLSGYKITQLELTKNKSKNIFVASIDLSDYDLNLTNKEVENNLLTQNTMAHSSNRLNIINITNNFINYPIRLLYQNNYFDKNLYELIISTRQKTTYNLKQNKPSFAIMNVYEYLSNFSENIDKYIPVGLWAKLNMGTKLVVARNSPYLNIKSLFNKEKIHIGVYDEMGYILVKKIIKKYKISPNKVKIIQFKEDILTKAMELGYLDGICLSENKIQLLGTNRFNVLYQSNESHYYMIIANISNTNGNLTNILTTAKKILEIPQTLKINSQNEQLYEFFKETANITTDIFKLIITKSKYFDWEENQKMAKNGALINILKNTNKEMEKYTNYPIIDFNQIDIKLKKIYGVDQ